MRPVLWEVADVVEQIFRIACSENLHPRPEEFDAAACDYQAANGLTYSKMREEMHQYGAMLEINERAQVIALMRLYRARWRPWDPEGARMRRSSRQPRGEKPAREKSPPKGNESSAALIRSSPRAPP